MQDFHDHSSTESTETTQQESADAKLPKSVALWMSRLQRLAARGSVWTICHIKETSSVTWEHFRSLIVYGFALWELRSLRNAARLARLDVGKELYSLERGDESLRKQIDQLDDQLEKLRSDNKSTRKLTREKNNMFIQLASQAEATSASSKLRAPMQQADQQVEQQTLKLTEQRKELCSQTGQHKVHIGLGYAASLLVIFVSANLFGSAISEGDSTSREIAVAQVDQSKENPATVQASQIEQATPQQAAAQKSLPKETPQATPRNPFVEIDETTIPTKKTTTPAPHGISKQPRSTTVADKTTSPRSIPSGFGTQSDPRLLTPDPTSQGSVVSVSVRKTYVVRGIGGVVMAGLDQALDGRGGNGI